jgi:hypothetical protein
MVAYPHERELAHLHHVRVLASNQLGAADLGLKKILALSTLVSFEYALNIAPKPAYSELFRRSYAVLEKDRLVPPSVLVLAFGLAAYLQLDDRARLFDHRRPAYATIPSREVRRNVRALWATVVDALIASSRGDREAALLSASEIRAGLRASRFVKHTFLSLLTTADLIGALLQDDGDRILRAWVDREHFVYSCTKKKKDLYPPAGLLDLTALAIADTTGTSGSYRPAFVPLLRPLTSCPRAS